jgi:hypothetical protein
MGSQPMPAPMPPSPPPMQIASPQMMGAGPQPQPQPQGQQQRLSPQQMMQQAAARRTIAPVEPWAATLKLFCMIFGGMLVLTFVLPWAVGGGHTSFSWSMMKMPGAGPKVWPILLLLAGLIAFIPGILANLEMGFRALGAAIAGTILTLLPLILGPFPVGGGFVKEWHLWVWTLGMVSASTGLLIRGQYRAASFGKILATVGALMILATLLIPDHGQVPLVGLFKALGSKEPFKQKLVEIIPQIVLALLCVLSFLVWLGPETSAGGTILSWLFISFPAFWMAFLPLLIVRKFEGIGHEPAKLYMLVNALGIPALITYGYSSIVGKYLE